MASMGRPENDLPLAGPLTDLAQWLRQLRERSALTYQAMAHITSLHPTTLSRAADGKHVPQWETVLAYTRACGGNTVKAQRLWTRAGSTAANKRHLDPLPRNLTRHPAHVLTTADLVAALRHLRIAAGLPPLRNLERAGGGLLPDATVSDLLRGRVRNPRREVVLAFVRGCGVPDNQLHLWKEAWKRATDPESGHRYANHEPAPVRQHPQRPTLSRREQREWLHAMIERYHNGSIDDLPQALGVGSKTFGEILKGRRRPSPGLVRRLAEAVGADCEELLAELGLMDTR
jgi:transcriptional regulator with XRE-family HTH domain